MRREVAAAALALAVLGVAWAGLTEGAGTWRPVALCALAAAPALATLAPRGGGPLALGAALAVAPAALALALRVPVTDLVSLDAESWGRARAVLPEGLREGADAALPLEPAELPALAALLDLALVALAAAAAWQIVARGRPVAGIVAVGVGLAYRWTVEPPGSGVAAGALALAALAGVLALASWERAPAGRVGGRIAGVAALGGAAALVAAGLGAGPAAADAAWWSWRDWEIGGRQAGAGAALDLRQRYGSLEWPETPRVALTVRSDRSPPLRAVALEEFDGVAFHLGDGGSTPVRSLPIDSGTILVDDPPPPGTEVVRQDVTLVGASTQVLLASGRPVTVTGPFGAEADLIGEAIRVEERLGPGDGYAVITALPSARPRDLLRIGRYDPAVAPPGATALRAGYWEPAVETPLWGTGGTAPPDAALGPYAEVRDLARRVAGDAASPYAAVNRIESHLRRAYAYDERPPDPPVGGGPYGWSPRRPPLVDFLTRTRRGFCQHFAGAMAVMLRSLGIPARVAVGYTGGRFEADEGAWVVLDRDAHSWVEVWFPGHGWLPFDPTPGRSAPNAASVSSPDYAPRRFEIDLSGLTSVSVDPAPPGPAPGREDDGVREEGDGEAVAGTRGDGGGPPAWLWALAASMAALPAVPGAARALGRARRRRAGDERARVGAALRELESDLRALGLAPPAAGTATERASAVRAAAGIDPGALYRRAARARFAPGGPPAGEAAAAWRESDALRRAARRAASPGRRLRAALAPRRPARATLDP